MAKDGKSAKVLAFGVRTVTSELPKGATSTTAVTLTATVERSGSTFRISRLDPGSNPGLPRGSDQLVVAAEVGRSEVVDLLSFRHDAFDADLTRALNNAVEPCAPA